MARVLFYNDVYGKFYNLQPQDGYFTEAALLPGDMVIMDSRKHDRFAFLRGKIAEIGLSVVSTIYNRKDGCLLVVGEKEE